jgi:hypothetical protein
MSYNRPGNRSFRFRRSATSNMETVARQAAEARHGWLFGRSRNRFAFIGAISGIISGNLPIVKQ